MDGRPAWSHTISNHSSIDLDFASKPMGISANAISSTSWSSSRPSAILGAVAAAMTRRKGRSRGLRDDDEGSKTPLPIETPEPTWLLEQTELETEDPVRSAIPLGEKADAAPATAPPITKASPHGRRFPRPAWKPFCDTPGILKVDTLSLSLSESGLQSGDGDLILRLGPTTY